MTRFRDSVSRIRAIALSSISLVVSAQAMAATDASGEPTECHAPLPPGLSYPQAIQQSIERCLFLAPGIQGNPSCEVEFDQSEQGVVTAVRMLRCDLAPVEFGHHVLRAIRKASPLPTPTSGQAVPHTIRVVFRPDIERIRQAQKRDTTEYHTEMTSLQKKESGISDNTYKEQQRLAEAEIAAKLESLTREYPGSRIVRSPEKDFLFATYYKQFAAVMGQAARRSYKEEADGKFGFCQAIVTLGSDGNLLEYWVHRCGPSEPKLTAATRKTIERSEFPPFPSEITSQHGVLHLLASIFYEAPDREAPSRSVIGVTMLPVTAELARSLGWTEPQGVVISEARPGGPADEAGIQRGDIILEFGSSPVFSPADILGQLAVFRPGSVITLKVWRQGITRLLSITLRELKADTSADRLPGSQASRNAGVADCCLAITEATLSGTSWIEQIRAKIRGNLKLPESSPTNLTAVFSVLQLPSGEILSINLKSSSGNPLYDRAVERAILKSSPLPKAPTAQDFRKNLELAVSP